MIRPWLLKLDVHGSELKILAGAEHVLTDSVRWVDVETYFIRTYADQPHHADVDRYLCSRGFRLRKLDVRKWKDIQGKWVPIFADALYEKVGR